MWDKVKLTIQTKITDLFCNLLYMYFENYSDSTYLPEEITSFIRPKIVGFLGGLSKEGLLCTCYYKKKERHLRQMEK